MVWHPQWFRFALPPAACIRPECIVESRLIDDADLSEADQERCRAYPVYALDLDQFPITEGLSLFAFETPLLPESISSMAK